MKVTHCDNTGQNAPVLPVVAALHHIPLTVVTCGPSRVIPDDRNSELVGVVGLVGIEVYAWCSKIIRSALARTFLSTMHTPLYPPAHLPPNQLLDLLPGIEPPNGVNTDAIIEIRCPGIEPVTNRPGIGRKFGVISLGLRQFVRPGGVFG